MSAGGKLFAVEFPVCYERVQLYLQYALYCIVSVHKYVRTYVIVRKCTIYNTYVVLLHYSGTHIRVIYVK